jgi:hypothetical protein
MTAPSVCVAALRVVLLAFDFDDTAQTYRRASLPLLLAEIRVVKY